MRTKLQLQAVLGISCVLVLCWVCRAGEVKGRVHDFQSEQIGIPAVEVFLFELTPADEEVIEEGMKLTREPDDRTRTDVDGDYSLDDVKDGKVLVRFRRVGYIQSPTYRKADLDSNGLELFVKMMDSALVRSLNVPYCKAAVTNAVERAQAMGDLSKGYGMIAKELQAMGVSAQWKSMFYKAVVAKDKDAADACPMCKQYLMVDPRDLDRAAEELKEGLRKGEFPQSNNTSSLPDIVFSDLVQGVLVSENVAADRREQFLGGLEDKFGVEKAGLIKTRVDDLRGFNLP